MIPHFNRVCFCEMLSVTKKITFDFFLTTYLIQHGFHIPTFVLTSKSLDLFLELVAICSSIEFQAPQPLHFPVHFGLSWPHDVQ